MGCIADDPSPPAALAAAVSAVWPGARVEHVAATADLPDAACLVVQATADVDAVTAARRLRTRGFAGGLVLVLPADREWPSEALARLGAVPVASMDDLVREGATIIETALRATGVRDDAPAVQALRRSRRLLAAGEIALGLRHALNNPLTAIMAEAQLLQLEDLPEEHAAAVGRIVEQCRRLSALTRQLDGIT